MPLMEIQKFKGAVCVKTVTDEIVKAWIKKESIRLAKEQPYQVKYALNRIKFVNEPANLSVTCLKFFTNGATELRRSLYQNVMDDIQNVLVK